MTPTRRLLLLATLLAGCGDTTANTGPTGLRETGYLTCEVSDTACPGALSCIDGAGQPSCVALPAGCDEGVSCGCAAEAVCTGDAICADSASGIQCTAETGAQPDTDVLEPLDIPLLDDADTPEPDDIPLLDVQYADVFPDDSSSTEACDKAASALAAEMYADNGACTTVIRLDYTSLEILGYQLVCGPYAPVSAESAHASAQATIPEADFDNDDSPVEYTYTFFQDPTDFGAVAAVDANTGQVAFAGTIIWSGAGDIVTPTTWRPASDLGSCDDEAGISTISFPHHFSGLPDAPLVEIVEIIDETAVPAAAWSGGYVFGATVIRYPRSVGHFKPDTAEWIVLVHSGWLE